MQSEKGHGVDAPRPAWLQKDHQWPGMRSVAKVEPANCYEDKVEEETRYYRSLPGGKQIGHAVRSNWGGRVSVASR